MEFENCPFCKIVSGEIDVPRVYEDDEFIAINDKSPKAPIHVLVIPKEHVDKRNVEFTRNDRFWGAIMLRVGDIVTQLGLSDKGYVLQLNGGGYNHLWHEHIHILGGLEVEP